MAGDYLSPREAGFMVSGLASLTSNPDTKDSQVRYLAGLHALHFIREAMKGVEGTTGSVLAAMGPQAVTAAVSLVERAQLRSGKYGIPNHNQLQTAEEIISYAATMETPPPTQGM